MGAQSYTIAVSLWHTWLMSSLRDLTSQLQSISEELGDKALEILKRAHRAGESKRPDTERSLTQARRAVEKAINLLGRMSSDD